AGAGPFGPRLAGIAVLGHADLEFGACVAGAGGGDVPAPGLDELAEGVELDDAVVLLIGDEDVAVAGAGGDAAGDGALLAGGLVGVALLPELGRGGARCGGEEDGEQGE